ncbi:MAG: hypothetical protein LBS56_09960 [Propionibacteriaceae bacterium]|jgi:predicted histidine transporter YuiF (NhaC family)|nr:hypothetical protein [Propionibacteriaceae bacterium]
MKTRARPRDRAAFCLGVLCLILAVGAAAGMIVPWAVALIPVVIPIVLIALAVLALMGLRS